MQGIHLLIDVYNILNNELIKTVEGIEPLMIKIIEEIELNVKGKLLHQFEPFGATLLYLLSESHLSIHTYYEEKCVAIDLYCCNPNIDINKALEIIYDYFNGDCIIKKNIIER